MLGCGGGMGGFGESKLVAEAEIRFVDADELQGWRQQGRRIVLLDVRERSDYQGGTIVGAENLPQGDIYINREAAMPLVEAVAAQAAESELVLFANTGGSDGMMASRDLYVLSILAELGGVPVERMVRLRGGLNGWKAAGLPVEPALAPAPAKATSLVALLDAAGLAHLAEPLADVSLGQLADVLAEGRSHLLELAKAKGVKLPDRQKLAKALSRNQAAADSASAAAGGGETGPQTAAAALAPAVAGTSVNDVD